MGTNGTFDARRVQTTVRQHLLWIAVFDELVGQPQVQNGNLHAQRGQGFGHTRARAAATAASFGYGVTLLS